YGNRVGVFRLADQFGELNLPVSLLVNAEMYRHAPEAVAAFPRAEIVGHGRSNSERQGDLTEYKERLLHEAGYRYLLDWCHDDQPVWMKTRGGRILSLPYPQELNDIPQIVARKREGSEFADMIVDAFEVMHQECTKRPLVMGIALHAYVVGWPHRFKHLARAMRHIASHADERVWFTTAGDIADYAEQLPAGTVP